MVERTKLTETQDIIHARHILAGWRVGEPITQSEKELVEGIFEHVVERLTAARQRIAEIRRAVEEI